MAQFKITILLMCMAAVILTAMADPDPLLDLCVGGLYSPCKTNVTAADFFYTGMAKPKDPNDQSSGVSTSPAMVTQWPALHTIGLFMLRITFAEGGGGDPAHAPSLVGDDLPHQGRGVRGFVGTENKLDDGVLEEGHAVIFPRGVVHFSSNVGKGPAYAIALFNGENPGAQFLPQTLFGNSNIGDALLAEAFGISEKTVKSLKAQFKAKFGDV